jgi:diacylglycerol kinase (ATP)
MDAAERTVVISNPTAGRGRTGALAAWQHRLPPGTQWRATEAPGDAVRLAAQAVKDGATTIASAGGDGTLHEVLNGIVNAGPHGVRLLPLPLGSMNDYAYTLGIAAWWRANGRWEELRPMAVDLGVARTASTTRRFINGAGVGFNGMVTIEARKIRWLRGVPLYALAVLQAMRKHFVPHTLSLCDERASWTGPTLALTLGLAQREGGFPLTARAKLDDGLFDGVQIGPIRRWELLRYFPGMLRGRLPQTHPYVRQWQFASLKVQSDREMCIHLDGEFLAMPGDGLREASFEVEPHALNCWCWPPGLYGGRA